MSALLVSCDRVYRWLLHCTHATCRFLQRSLRAISKMVDAGAVRGDAFPAIGLVDRPIGTAHSAEFTLAARTSPFDFAQGKLQAAPYGWAAISNIAVTNGCWARAQVHPIKTCRQR